MVKLQKARGYVRSAGNLLQMLKASGAITEPRSGSDRVGRTPFNFQENKNLSYVDCRATGPGRYRSSVL